MWSWLFGKRKTPRVNAPITKTTTPRQRQSPWKSPTKPLTAKPLAQSQSIKPNTGDVNVVRHFFNEERFQCYASFFPHWGGWVTAGHCMTDAQDHIPPFAHGHRVKWPDGLDAALIGCQLPKDPPRPPRNGEQVIAEGYPAGSRHLEQRRGSVYFQRSPGVWIIHIKSPDEPVVTGMSGGRVRSLETGETLGIIITRNSPADLDRDRDPDESCDFTALHDVWHAVRGQAMV